MSLKVWACWPLFLATVLGAPASACSVSATSLNFGVIDPLAAAGASSTATVSVDCPEAGSYTVAVSTGNGGYDQRYLVNGGHRLYYNVYTDQSHTQVIGDGSGVSVTLPGDANTTSYTLYGRLPAQPLVVPGLYGDNLVITLSY